MSGDGTAIKVISVLGNDYSIKVPVGKEADLSASVLLLKRLLAETKAQSSTLIGERLLVLTALKLCAQQVELEQAEGDPHFAWQWPDDEWQAISLNYISGTTGNPKGVVYHHRGAYLNSLGNQMTWAMGHHPVYLWTLPMFHCNGWCYPWTITALAGVHVFLRRVDPQKILHLIREHRVSHLCGAPIVLNALVNMPESAKAAIEHPVNAMVAGAAPPAKVIGAVEEMGIKVTHVYGLTEVYGPVTVCAWHAEWDELSLEQRAQIKSRQGVRYPTLEGLMVGDPKTLEPTPRDGETIGEIFMRGRG